MPRIYLLDWDNGFPWGVVVADNEAEAHALALQEVRALNPYKLFSPNEVRVTGSVGMDEEVPVTYFPHIWRWHKPG